MPSDELYRLLRRWDAYRSEMLAFMGRYDVILCPVYTCPAVPHGGTSRPELWDAISYTTPYSLTGWPCATVRCGTSSEGLPIDVQLVAGPWRDDVALAAALHLERVLGGWQPPAL
jgi:amidase